MSWAVASSTSVFGACTLLSASYALQCQDRCTKLPFGADSNAKKYSGSLVVGIGGGMLDVGIGSEKLWDSALVSLGGGHGSPLFSHSLA